MIGSKRIYIKSSKEGVRKREGIEREIRRVDKMEFNDSLDPFFVLRKVEGLLFTLRV